MKIYNNNISEKGQIPVEFTKCSITFVGVDGDSILFGAPEADYIFTGPESQNRGILTCSVSIWRL